MALLLLIQRLKTEFRYLQTLALNTQITSKTIAIFIVI